MAPDGQGTELPDSADETLVEFPDNRLLIDLCGQFDRNLTQLEQGFGVQILRRGNQLLLHGVAEAREHAHEALTALYERLEEGRGLEPADIDAVIRMGPAPDEPAEDTQLDMFPGGRLEIRTRRPAPPMHSPDRRRRRSDRR